MAEVTELKSPKTDKTEDTPFDNEPSQTTPTPPPAKPGRGRPPGSQKRPPDVRQPAFFDLVAAVPTEDWGARAFMYVYVDEPCCNPKTFGESRYLLKSSKPILDLEGLKQDYGSFKGWMSLNTRKSGKDATDEVDRLNFEIYDPKHPPKIPRGSWANDARNKRWLDLLPPEAPPASAAASSLLEGARFYKDIREELKEEMGTPESPQTRTSEVLETMKAAKELFGPSAAAPAAPVSDPFDLAAKIMAMRSNDPMTQILMGMVDNANKATEAAREREFKLQQQLMEARTAPAVASKSFLEQAIELANSAEKLEPLKKILGFTGGAAEATGRVAKSTGMDLLRDVITTPDVAKGLGVFLSNVPTMIRMFTQTAPVNGNGASTQTQPITVHPEVQNGSAVETPEQKIRRIATTWTRPMIYEFFLAKETGESFAANMWNMAPEDFTFLKSLGAETLVNSYRSFQMAWQIIEPKEADFIEFMTEFCAFDPNADEVPAPPDNGDDGFTDPPEEPDNASS